MSAVEELTKICASLPPDKARRLATVLKLEQRRAILKSKLDAVSEQIAKLGSEIFSESEDDATWEKIIANPKPRPKLDAYIAAAMAEGPSLPLEGNL